MSAPRRRRRDVASSDHSTDADLDELRRRSSEVEGVDRSDAFEAARLSNLIFERTRAYRLAIIRPYVNVHRTGLWIAFAAFTAAGWKDVRSGVSLGPVPIRSPLGYLVAYAWALAFLAALVFKAVAPVAYERSYEIVCEGLCWTALGARQYSMLRGNKVWMPLRPITMVMSMIMLRFEFSKQAKWFIFRNVVDSCGHAGRHYVEGGGGGANAYVRCLNRQIPMCVVKIVFGLAFHWWIERRDKVRFLQKYSVVDARLVAAVRERERDRDRGCADAFGEDDFFGRGLGKRVSAGAIVVAVTLYAIEHLNAGT